jgi:prevent-host-death family protein
MTTLDRQPNSTFLMAKFNVADAKSRFSELIQKAMAGEEVIIARDNKPVVKLVALVTPASCAIGIRQGKIWLAPDFTRPLLISWTTPDARAVDTHAFQWWVDDARLCPGRPGLRSPTRATNVC